MTDIVRKLADDDPNDDETWSGTAEVTSADAGSTSDGRRLITVRWNGTSVSCAYLASYTPVVGHKVTFLKNGPVLFVLGKPASV